MGVRIYKKLEGGKRRRFGEFFQGALLNHKDEILQYMRESWDETERMAKKEEVVRQVRDAAHRAGELLFVLGVIGGACFVAAVAPNVFAAFGKMGKRKYFLNASTAKRDIYYCRRLRYISFRKTGGGEYEIQITDKGLRRALQKGFEEIRARNKTWDGWWRIVMFDIPETKKGERDGLRRKLVHLGFYQMQKSVFVCPYSCDKELDFLIAFFHISPFITRLKVKDVEGEEVLREHFHL